MQELIIFGQAVIKYAPLLVGVVMPIAADYLIQDIHTKVGKRFVAIALCVLAAFLTQFNSILVGDPEQVAATATLLWAEAEATYRFYFKESILREKIRSIYIKEEKGESDLSPIG